MDVASTLESSGTKAAKELCEQSMGPVANLCGSALEKADQGTEAVEKTLDQAGAIEMASPVWGPMDSNWS